MLKQTVRRAQSLFSFRSAKPYPLAKLPPHVERMLHTVRERRLTYLGEKRLNLLAATCVEIQQGQIPGRIIEVGCALGGSSVLLASAKSPQRRLAVYDVFGMIPPPSKRDGADVTKRYDVIRRGESKGIGGKPYYGYVENLYEKVKDTFAELGYPLAEHHVSLVKGLIEETLEVTGPVALAHIDCDWYEPVSVALKRIEPYLSAGGSIIVDDYADWSGCRGAVDEYFAGKDRSGYEFDDRAGSLKITKLG